MGLFTNLLSSLFTSETGNWWRLFCYSFPSFSYVSLCFSTSSPFLFKFSAGMGMGMGIGVVTNLAKMVLVEINVFL